MVKVWARLVPPLVQPRSPEVPLGVFTVTLAVPGPVINVVGRVACNCCALVTVVASVVPLTTTTEDATNRLPFSVSTNPCCVWAKVAVVGWIEVRIGAGRALPHRGLSALQLGRTSKASTSALRGRQDAQNTLIRHGTRGCQIGPQFRGRLDTDGSMAGFSASLQLDSRTFTSAVGGPSRLGGMPLICR